MLRNAKWLVAILAAIIVSLFLNDPELENNTPRSKSDKPFKTKEALDADRADDPLDSGGQTKHDRTSSHKSRASEPRERSKRPVSDSKLSHDTAQIYKVIRVVDGDTVIIDISGKPTRIRLIGVDTPETVHPNKPVQYFGKEASRFLKNLLKDEEVRMEYERAGSSKDKYDRTLAYLYRARDNLFINAEIIRQGYGYAYTRYPFKHMEKFRSLEKSARQSKRGLWAESNKREEKGDSE